MIPRPDILPDTQLSKIEYNIRLALVSALDRDNDWRRIVDFLRRQHIFEYVSVIGCCFLNSFPLLSIKFPPKYNTNICNRNADFTNSFGETGGMKLLTELDNLICTIDDLSQILLECKLYDALSLFYTERIRVVREPDDNLHGNLSVKLGDIFLLEYEVFGLPLPKYEWYKDNIPIFNQKESKINHANFSQGMAGKYYCIATQQLIDGNTEIIKSNSVLVEVFPERCVILKKPLPKICKREGESVVFKVKVNGYPLPQYEWTHNNKILGHVPGNEFFKLKCGFEDSGDYRCRVWNSSNELIIQTNLSILDSGYLFPVCRTSVPKKVALLIGNQTYENNSPLHTPTNDVDTLEPLLRSIDFLVIKKHNLNLMQIKQILADFSNMLVQGAYVLIYFGGHGFELGEKYLLPVDAPNATNYKHKDCICDGQILRDILRTKPKLFMLLLDMCLELPSRVVNRGIYEEDREIFEYEPDRNLIQAYSTSSGLRSYEIGERDTAYNSVYVRALKDYIARDISVLKILANVNTYIENFFKQTTLIKQIPHVSFNVVQDFYLNVPVKGQF